MGMRANLTILSPSDVTAASDWSDEQIYERLTSADAVEIDKSWEVAFPLIGQIAGTGMMLTDNAAPIGGELVFGPAMIVDATEVATINSALVGVDDDHAAAQLATLSSPFMATGPDDDEGRSFGLWGFRETANVFAAAARDSSAVLFAIL
ncbi:MAG: DUF1877 family protein [Actinomycetota bacterium]